ncbi:hypothetical protein GRS48_01615 [Halorubrum sp. JWXQ-INN 858]|uniref:hypothetical protein n=1 Tax=Halorubrum sp. JWXQ-INN 858 TaxID=2690782 RepID=UPI00135C74B5|nr:hypothetical protein [Halorubrum sp. JWXQ-INN 858]MWV63525.1 hypothetical protein [Halorubrum sp. JWXQ-INN 858]
METILFGFLFAGLVAYGVVCLSAPVLSLHLDGTAKRQDGNVGPTAVRNRRYAGGVVVIVGMLGASFLVGLGGVALCVLVATLARFWVETQEEPTAA